MQSREELETLRTLMRLMETARRDADELEKLANAKDQRADKQLRLLAGTLRKVADDARKALVDAIK